MFTRDQDNDVINRHQLSRAITDPSFNFIPYVEADISVGGRLPSPRPSLLEISARSRVNPLT